MDKKERAELARRMVSEEQIAPLFTEQHQRQHIRRTERGPVIAGQKLRWDGTEVRKKKHRGKGREEI